MPRIPTPDLTKAGPRLAGFAAGIVGMLVLSAFVTVVYSGRGFWSEPPTPPQVYTDF
jgi:hypothetical protein